MIYRLNDEYFVRGLCEADLAGPYPTWFEDQEVSRFNSHGKWVRTEDYFREYVRSLNGSDKVVWAICHERAGHVGNVTLQAISPIDRAAEFAVIIGEREHRSKGLGKLAGRKLLEHGFAKLNLHRVYCGTAATNDGMKRLALALGMKQEGVRRAHMFLDGQWVDLVEYGILRDEFSGGDLS